MKRKSYPWCLSYPVHYPISNPLKKCCISAFSFFFFFCSTVSWPSSIWIVVLVNELMQQKRHPNWPAWQYCFSHLQPPLLPEKKCLRRHLLLGVGFQWMLWKQFIQLIDKGCPRLYSVQEAWHRSEVGFLSLWLGEPWHPCFLKNESECKLATFKRLFLYNSARFVATSRPRCLQFKSAFKLTAKTVLVFYWEATSKS